MSARAAKRKDGDAAAGSPDRLVRESAGRYRSVDGRFTAESQGPAAWFLVDAERTNEFGLPQMTGPYRTLGEVRDAMGDARSAAHAPVPAPVPKGRGQEDRARDDRSRRAGRQRVEAEIAGPVDRMLDTPRPSEPHTAAGPPPEDDRSRTGEARPATQPARNGRRKRVSWLERQEPGVQEKARRMILALERVGVPDGERVVRAEVEGGFPHLAGSLLAHRLSGDAIEVWRTDPGWIDEWMDSRDRRMRSDVARVVREIVDAGVSREDVAHLAELVALQTAARVLERVAGDGSDEADDDLPGWRLIEVDRDGKPTGRRLLLTEDDLLRAGS